jgi:putative methyltransferase (TIGR04325 family)
MSAALRAGVKALIPPLLVDVLRRMRTPVVSFSGAYDSWQAASEDASGYDADSILARVVAATRKVAAGEAAFERDSVLFDEIEYSWPLLAALLYVAAAGRSLRVIDFGGSLGSSWRQNRRFIDRLTVPVSWSVVEQPNFVAAGRQNFSNDVLRFHDSIAEAAVGGVDVVLFSSSLCYVAEPARFVAEAWESGARFLAVDRLPLIRGSGDRIRLQHVHEPIYEASYPIRLFGSDTLFDSLFARWRLIEQWDSELQPDPASHCRGFLLERP